MVFFYDSYVARQIVSHVKSLPGGGRDVVLVLTDGAQNMIAAQGIIETSLPSASAATCMTHVCNLSLKEAGAIASIDAIISMGKKVNTWVNERHAPRALLRSATKLCCKTELSPIQPCDTRFGIHFMMLDRLVVMEKALKHVATHPSIANDKEPAVVEALDIIKDDIFWKDARKLTIALKPVFSFMRLTDSDRPVMGLVVHAYRQTRDKLQKLIDDEKGWALGERISVVELEEVLAAVNRIGISLRPIHYAAYMLNPRLWDVSSVTGMPEVMAGFDAFCEKTFAWHADCADRVTEAKKQLLIFKEKKGRFSMPGVQSAAGKTTHEASAEPGVLGFAEWWKVNGYEVPLLQTVAMRCLSQVVSISSAERDWKSQKWMQTKIRNRLGSGTVDQLMVVHSSLQVKSRVGCIADWDEEGEGEGGDRAEAVRMSALWYNEEKRRTQRDPIYDGEGEEGKETEDFNRVFMAEMEHWESEKLRAHEEGSRTRFTVKYVGLCMQVRYKDEPEVEHRTIIDVVWQKVERARHKEWQLVSTKLEKDEGTGLMLQSDDESDIEVHRFCAALYDMIVASPHNAGVLMRGRAADAVALPV